ncbi:hypothetical protein FB451DRAFT_1396460 [Mycena latifolia]|nr:hypothetical protein FB451DRAFT_1396460 [Mycena latifolia]
MLDDSKLVKHFPALLTALKKRIKSLPSSLPLGDADGHLSRYFGDLEVDAEGAAFSANRQWERVFQGSEEEKHTMSDARSSMAASTASSTVVTKELLNAGFGEGLDYLEGITIN